MPHFQELDFNGQVQALERLGRVALEEFGVAPTLIRPLDHAENTTYDVESAFGRFNLRISRPGYQSTANIRSEIALLSALRADGYPVPAPWQDRIVTAAHPDVPEPRDCVLLGWLDGEMRTGEVAASTEEMRRLGALMARLHAFTQTWSRPADFVRQQMHAWAWDPDQIRPIDQPVAGVSEAQRTLMQRIDDESRALILNLPQTPSTFGLIHADLHAGNVLYTPDGINIIDFDDTSFGFFYYDFAATLAYELRRPEFPAIRDAMFEGYTSVRPLPPDTEALLPAWLRARFVGVGQWFLSRTDNPAFRAEAPEWIQMICARIEKTYEIG